MSTPLVSVVVPVYNLEFYVARCLESLAMQTFERLEVVVVNDGGSDDSQLIIEEYVAKFPGRFVSHAKENGGHGSACNYGIQHAHGDYVMIVDGDDFLDADTVQYMYDKIVEQDADLLIGNLLYIFTDHREPYRPIQIESERLLDDKDRRQLYMNWPTPCGRLYRRSLFTANPDLTFLPGVIFADANFAPKSYLEAKRIYYVNRELYNYDITRPTQSLKQTDKRILNIIPVLRDMLEYYRRRSEFDSHRNELMRYVARHCVSWIPRIQGLTDYPKDRALNEVFAVADEYFGKDWLTCGVVFESFGRRVYWQVKLARMFGYPSLVSAWRAKAGFSKVDRFMEKVFVFPLRAYRGGRRRLVSRVGWLFN